MTLFLYLIKTYLIFLFFTLIITLFGGILVYFLRQRSKKKWNLTLLEYCFISYAVGIMLFILLSYIIHFFIFFNFYSVILPILIVSIIFLIYLYKKKKIHTALALIKNTLILERKKIIRNILILSLIFILQFITLWPVASNSNQLLDIDPYIWVKHVSYLNENGVINYTQRSHIYPWGFDFFCGGNLSICPDFKTTYFFIKFACFPFLNLYILVIFSISKRVLKNPSLILYCLIFVLSQSYFLCRSMMFLSSSISILLISISFLILLTETPNYLLGFIIPATFLLNPAYTLFFIMVLAVLYIIKIIISYRDIVLIIKEILVISLLSISLCIVYIVSFINFYKQDLFTLFDKLFHFFEISSLNRLTYSLYPIINSSLVIISINLFSSLEEKFLFNLQYYGTMEPFFVVLILILPVLGLFLTYKEQERLNKEFIIFIKVGLILTYFITFVLPFFPMPAFFSTWYTRIIEALLPCLILLSGLFLKWALASSKKLWEKIKVKYERIRNFNNKNRFFKIINFQFFLISLIIISSYFTYNSTRKNIPYTYYYEDSLTECIFYTNSNVEKETNIAVNKFVRVFIKFVTVNSWTGIFYSLLYNFNLTFYHSLNFTTVNEFRDFLQSRKIDFLIINLSYFNQTFIDDFSTDLTFSKIFGGKTIEDFAVYEII